MTSLTIITVTHNPGPKLENTLKSVKRIKQDNLEYILIDGGSGNSVDILAKKYARIIDLYISEPDSGLYNAINKSIEYAKGDYIHLLHAGDTYSENFDFSKLDFTEGFKFYAFAVKKIQRDLSHVKYPRYDKWRKYIDVAHPGLIVKKEFYDCVDRYREDFRVSADSFFIHKYLKTESTHLSQDILVIMEPAGLSGEVSWSRHVESHRALLGLVRVSFYLRIIFHIKLIIIDLIRLSRSKNLN